MRSKEIGIFIYQFPIQHWLRSASGNIKKNGCAAESVRVYMAPFLTELGRDCGGRHTHDKQTSTLESTSLMTQAARPLRPQPEPAAESILAPGPPQNLLFSTQIGAVFLNAVCGVTKVPRGLPVPYLWVVGEGRYLSHT